MRRIIASLGLFMLLLMPATPALAYNPLAGACGAGSNTSSACDKSVNGSNPISGTNGVIRKVTSLIAVIAGIAAVIIIIIGGFQYVTSAGDPQKASSARNMILGALVGLVIIVAAQSILLFILSKV